MGEAMFKHHQEHDDYPIRPEAKKQLFAQQHKKLEAASLDSCPAHLWHHGCYGASCPRPILIDKYHQQQLEDLHEFLAVSINGIVDRWWVDKMRIFQRECI
ncbi:hypothetical protein HJFPF1_10116 [Paramyrothecium foliicola]|nr:hypothetical protein HJFPF1_10116 [Paramyrothecium foliicola]